MAITELYSGSQIASALGGTEWSVTTGTSGPDADTTDGVYQVFLDLSGMIATDSLQVRVYEKTRSADTQRIVYQTEINGLLPEPIWVSPFLTLMHGWDFTFKALAGNSITVNWSVRTAG